MRTYVLLLLSGSLLASACSESSTAPLNADERKLVSQQYADTVRVLTPLVDSACTANHERLVAALADSIYQARLANLDRQRKRPSL